MRLYVKLALFVALFLGMAWASGDGGRERAWELSFAARCYVADLLGDERLEERLVAEARAQIQRWREDAGEPAMIDSITTGGVPAGA